MITTVITTQAAVAMIAPYLQMDVEIILHKEAGLKENLNFPNKTVCVFIKLIL